jgi:Thrombospondin type 3 repeat
MNHRMLRLLTAYYQSSRVLQRVTQVALLTGASVSALGCACESITREAPTSPPEALSVQCGCDIVGQTLDAVTQQTKHIDSTFCVPEAFRSNPGSYCASADVKGFIEKNTLGILDTFLPGTCSTAQVVATCSPLPGAEAGQSAPSCAGTCPAAACDSSSCSESELFAGGCACTQGASCGAPPSAPVCSPTFDGHLVVSPDEPLDVGEGQAARDSLFSMAGGWLPGSLFSAAVDFESCAPDGSCSRLADAATSEISGTFELIGFPCPFGSCSVGFHSQIELADFELTLDAPHAFTDVEVDVFAPPGAVPVGAAGFGFIQPGNLLVNVTGKDNGVAKIIEQQLNDFPVFFTVDWATRRLQIPTFSVAFAGGEGSITAQLDGTFGSSVAETLDPSLYVPVEVGTDSDGDGIVDQVDNCPLVSNPSQAAVPSPIVVVGSPIRGCDVANLEPPLAEDVCFGDPVTVTPNITSVHPGTSSITWTATDSRGQVATAIQAISNLPALAASGLVQIADRGKVSGGSIVSLGTSSTTVGTDSQISSFLANGSIDVRDRTRVLGQLVSAGSIRLGHRVVVDPTAVQRNTAPGVGSFPELSVPSFSVGTTNISLEPGRSRSISPGRYNTLKVASRATLTLTGGDYYMNTLQLEPDSRLVLNGQARLFVRSGLTLRGSIDAGGNVPMLVYTGTSSVTLERSASLELRAPRARVYLGSGNQLAFQGNFFAKELVVSPGAAVTCTAGQ